LFERLEQLMAAPEPAKRKEPVPAAERPRVFAGKLADDLGEILLECEERIACGRVKIVVTVDGNVSQLRERILSLARDVFGEERDIEIMDRQTAETLARLIEGGLLQTSGEIHPLYPAVKAPELSDAAKERINELRTGAVRNLSMANLLADNRFHDGAVSPLHEAIRQLTFLRIVERGLPEPDMARLSYETGWPPDVAGFMEHPDPEQVPEILKILSAPVE